MNEVLRFVAVTSFRSLFSYKFEAKKVKVVQIWQLQLQLQGARKWAENRDLIMEKQMASSRNLPGNQRIGRIVYVAEICGEKD